MSKSLKKAAGVEASSVVKLVLGAGSASAAPPVGPALGQRGVKAMDFARQFNEQSKKFIPGIPLQAVITVKPDKSFSFVIRPPTTSYLLKRAAGLSAKSICGSTAYFVGQITPQQLYEISRVKATDPSFEGLKLEKIFTMVVSNARMMGLEIVKCNNRIKD